MGDALKKLADILSNKQVEPNPGVTPVNPAGGYNPGLTNDIADVIMQRFAPKNPYHASTDPNTTPFGTPNPEFNVTDTSQIEIDDEGLQGYWQNAWNSLKRGVDSIQSLTEFGKLNYSMLGDAPYQVVDNYDKHVADLEKSLNSGIITEAQYGKEREILDESLQKAQERIGKGEAYMAENDLEMKNEPVSKAFQIKNYYTQLQGDQASIGDKLAYSMPEIVGSSASLMGPQLAATFGTNITKALLRSSVAHLLGPELGVPANVIATVGAIALSIGEIAYGRYNESYGEIGGTIKDAQDKMKSEYMEANGLTNEKEIPEDVARDIREKSRAGADTQFKENMALAAVDVAQALIMPLSTFGGAVGKISSLTEKVSEIGEAARNYNKFTRVLGTVGKAGFEAMGEKFEEGFQFAAGKRAEDAIYNKNEFDNKGLISNILQDGYDVASSLNYSLIPGIDLRGSGKYSTDKEFQFSENSGAMLGLFMSAVPTALSIGKDIRAYKMANQDAARKGFMDVDGQFSRLNNSIMKRYFDNGQAHHLEQAVKSLVNKKDEKGEPILTEPQAQAIITDMRESYDMYNSISDKIDRNIAKDKAFGLFETAKLTKGKEMLKEDLFNAVTNIVRKDKNAAKYELRRAAQLAKDTALAGAEVGADFTDLSAKLDAIDELISEHVAEINKTGNSNKKRTLNSHLVQIGKVREEVASKIKEVEADLKENGVNMDDLISHSAALADIHKDIIVNELYSADAKKKYVELDKVRTRRDMEEYLLANENKPIPAKSKLAEADKPVVENTTTNVEDEDVVDNVEPEAQTDEDIQHTVEEEQGDFTVEELEYLRDGFKSILDNKEGKEGLSKFMNALGVPNENIYLDDVIKVATKLFVDEPNYITKNFDELQSLVHAANPASKDENYVYDAVDQIVHKVTAHPPTQSNGFDDLHNGEIHDAIERNEEDYLGTGTKIVSSLSVANAQVKGYVDPNTNRWYNAISNDGQLEYNTNDHQQLVNTSLVSKGDTLILKLDTVPPQFDASDTSTSNYDKLNIGIYKRITQGSITRELRIGALHTVAGADKALVYSEAIDRDAQLDQLHTQRLEIFKGGVGAEFEADVAAKGIGHFNLNGIKHKTTVALAIGKDTRPKVTVIDERKRVMNFWGYDTSTFKISEENAIMGAAVLLVPNHTDVGETYMSLYLTKHKIGVDNGDGSDGDKSIVNKVYKSLVGFMKTGDYRELRNAEKYIYVTSTDPEKLGVKGIYKRKLNDGTIQIQANNKLFTIDNLDGFREALAQVYFSPSKEWLENNEYQKEIMSVGVLTTNLAANPILQQRHASGEYNFIPDKEVNSYFSQHTIQVSNIRQVGVTPEAIDINEDIVPEADEEVKEKTIEEIQKDLEEEGEFLFDDLGPDIRREDSEVLTQTLKSALGLNSTAGARYSAEQVKEMRERLEDVNSTFKKNHKLLAIKTRKGDYAVTLEVDTFDIFDDLAAGSISVDIPASVQHQMIDSLAFRLSQNRRSEETDAEKATNADLVKAYILKRINDLEGEIKKGKVETTEDQERLSNMKQMLQYHYQIIDNFDGLIGAAKDMLENMGFKYDEDTDFYETLEESVDDGEYGEIRADEDNSTRNQKDFLPAEIKILLYFIPDLEAFIPDPKNPTKKERGGKRYWGTGYQPKGNDLGMPYFNNFNDTWEKTLAVTSSAYFPSVEEGFRKMLTALKHPDNPAVVKELAKEIEMLKNDQVNNSFFRRTNLQNQRNMTLLHTVNPVRSLPTREELGDDPFMDPYSPLKRGNKRKAVLVPADRKHAERQVVKQLENQFKASGTVLLTRGTEEHSGRESLMIDSARAKEISAELEAIIGSDDSYHLIPEKTLPDGTVIPAKRKGFLASTILQIHKIIHDKMGLKIGLPAFVDLINNFKLHGEGGNEFIIRNVFIGGEKTQGILKTLSGITKNDKELTTEVLKSYKTNNPFHINKDLMLAIAKQEYKYRKQRQPGSYRLEGKSYYAFTRHNYLSEMFIQVREFYNTKGAIDAFITGKLDNDKFAEHSLYLNRLKYNKNFRDKFTLMYELGARNTGSDNPIKLLKNMTDREHQVAKIALFQNQGARESVFMYDTLSDKTTKPLIKAERFDVQYTPQDIQNEDGSVTTYIWLKEDSIELLYSYFLTEYGRINDVVEQNQSLPKHELIKGYHDINGKEGMGKYFNIFYFLNKAVLDVEFPRFSDIIYESDGSLKEITPEVKGAVGELIKFHFNKLFHKHYDDFNSKGLWKIKENKKNGYGFSVDLTNLLDHNYFTGRWNNNSKRYEYGIVEHLNLEGAPGLEVAIKGAQYEALGIELVQEIIDYTVADYVFNFMIFSNEMMILTGDPAQAGKLADKSEIEAIDKKFKDNPKKAARAKVIANVKSTFTNLGKRNAAFLGSGEKGLFKESHYNVAIANDININDKNAPYIKQLLERFPDNQSGITKAYANGDMTDAQEVTTVREHLRVMLAYAMINKDKYKKALYLFDIDDYKREFGEDVPQMTNKEKQAIERLIMQPHKPVQRTYTINPNVIKISKQYYIKTSSYPLIPALVKGTPLEDLLTDMKKDENRIDRIAFVSGVKQGVAGAKDMFNKEGKYNSEFLANNKSTLHRDGFRIQLEVPYKPDKHEIREGSQAAKLLFVDINDDVELTYQGEKTTAKRLKDTFVNLHWDIISIKRKELLDELGLVEEGGRITWNKDKLKKLSDILRKEAMGRGYSPNSVKGLELNERGEFKIPLTFLPNAGQIEPVITAIISNRVARLKMPGRSDIQGSEFMLETGGKVQFESGENLEELKDYREIVWTKPEYAGMRKLGFMSVDEHGAKPAQIIMPFYLVKPGKDGEKGSKLDLAEYTVNKDGKTYLDTTMIDPELLQQFGFRIPFQGHNSGMWFEIVGFLPEKVGDLAIVPGEIAGQMGSDYDVDKLYSYMYNYNITDNGQVVKHSPKVDKDTSDEDKIRAYQNSIIDIHKAVFTSSNPGIVRSILSPLSFGDVENAIQLLGGSNESTFLGAFDTIYQRDVYFSNVMGKSGTAISANANTGHALAQRASLFIKGQGVVMLDDKGNPYSDYSSFEDENRVDKLTEDTYKYIVTIRNEEGKLVPEERNQNDENNNSAWRLDKIYTFPSPVDGKTYRISELISQILGISVDNAKEQKLGAFGINRHNFNTTLTIIRSGFDLFWAMAFINQPILKEYYKLIGETDDMFDIKFTPNKKKKVVEDLVEKYRVMFKINQNDVDEIMKRPFVEGFRFEDLKTSMRKSKQPITQANVMQQLEVLKAFLYYKDISDTLQAVTSTFNIDVKGLPKNISETAAKMDSINSMLSAPSALGNVDNYARKTIPGLFKDIPTLASSIFVFGRRPIFAYRTPAYMTAIENVKFASGRVELRQEQIDKIHNHIKQFVYSSFEFPDGERLDAARKRLVFDNELTGTKSIQTRLMELIEKYPKNELLNAMDILESEYPDDPKLVEITMSTEDDYQTRTTEHWEHMLYNDDEPELQSFARDLVKYALYVMPQEYGTSNIIKYVPFGYLEDIRFLDHLSDINDQASHDEYLLSSFARQFVQHNVDFLLTAREEHFVFGSERWDENGILTEFAVPALNTPRVVNQAASLIRSYDPKDESSGEFYPSFLSFYINEARDKLVYEKIQTPEKVRYVLIDKMEYGNMSQYTMNSENPRPRTIVPSEMVEVETYDPTAVVTASGSTAPDTNTRLGKEEYLVDGSTPDDILDGLIATGNNIVAGNSTREIKRYAKLYQWLAKELQYNLSGTKITVSDEHPTTATTAGDGSSIIFNPIRTKLGRTGLSMELEKQRTILHEFLHAKVFQELHNKGRMNSKEWRAIEEVWHAYKRGIWNASNMEKEVRGIPVDVFDAELFSVLKISYDAYRMSLTQGQVNLSFGAYIQATVNDDVALTQLLKTVGNRLEDLHTKGELTKKRDFDLTANKGRLEDFKEYVIKNFNDENVGEMINKYYGYHHIQEFVAEAMTNKVMQDIMRSMPSIWERFVDSIKDFINKILGIEKEDRTLLNDAFDAITTFIKKDEDGMDPSNNPGIPTAPITVYQGYNSMLPDGREFNYWAARSEEAQMYGSNVRSAKVELKKALQRRSDQFYNLTREFQEANGKRPDLLDNSPEGLITQNEFFAFLKRRGYDGITNLHNEDGTLKDFKGEYEDAYIVTFYDEVIDEKNVVSSRTSRGEQSIGEDTFDDLSGEGIIDYLVSKNIIKKKCE